jgi:hypothetical protein
VSTRRAGARASLRARRFTGSKIGGVACSTLQPMRNSGEAGVSNGETRLSQGQIDAVLNFIGYGNPAGPFWFIGIEERGVGGAATLWDELLVRAKHFAAIEDLKAAQEHPAFGSTFQVGQYVPTWLIMSKIVLRLSGAPDWHDYGQAQRYQADELGRGGGQTFLAELLPLPAGSVDDWPYPSLFPTKAVYREKVLPGRIATLRHLLDQHCPTYVFCYGKGYWSEYRQLFPDVTDFGDIGGFAKLGRTAGGTLIALTPFFSAYAMGHSRIDELALKLREDRFTYYDDDLDRLLGPNLRSLERPSDADTQ